MFMDKWRVLATAVIVLAVYFLEPSLFSEAIYAAFWLLVSFFIAGFLADGVRHLVVRRLIAFDVMGVLAYGDWAIEDVTPDPKMFDLVKRLRSKHRVAVWANQGPSMIDYFERQFHFKKLFDYVVVSGRIRLKKPDKAYYEKALQECNARASDTIFIDDQEENVKTARSLGINAIHFKSYEQLVEALKAYGISV